MFWSNISHSYCALLEHGYKVEDYPQSTAANAALKSMLAIETDYETLQGYYLFDNTIQSYNDLAYSSSSLANKCDENMYYYDRAIAWYENRITNPTTSYNDSIFARIDLMELQMQLGGKGEYIPRELYQMVPATRHLADDLEQSLLFTIPSAGNEKQQAYATQRDIYPLVENLEALFDSEDDVVALSWNMPKINSKEMRLSWAGQEVGDYFGPGYQHQLAQRFDSIDLMPFIGWRIKDISIYGPFDDGYIDYSQDTVSVMVWLAEKNGDTWETEEIFRSKLPDFIHYQLYTVELDTNIYIQGDRELWIGYEFLIPTTVGSGWPFAIDNSPLVFGKGSVSRAGFGDDWHDWLLDPYTFGHNLMISSTIENPNAGDSKSIGSALSSPEIVGFRVYRNETLIADLPHPVQTFYVDKNPGKAYPIEYCVTLLFEDGVESEPICITVDYTNIAAYAADDAIQVFPNPTHGLVHIGGTDILEVKVYDNMGRILSTYLNTNEIDLSELPDGVYTLRIIGENGHLVKKVVKFK